MFGMGWLLAPRNRARTVTWLVVEFAALTATVEGSELSDADCTVPVAGSIVPEVSCTVLATVTLFAVALNVRTCCVAGAV